MQLGLGDTKQVLFSANSTVVWEIVIYPERICVAIFILKYHPSFLAPVIFIWGGSSLGGAKKFSLQGKPWTTLTFLHAPRVHYVLLKLVNTNCFKVAVALLSSPVCTYRNLCPVLLPQQTELLSFLLTTNISAELVYRHQGIHGWSE